MPHAPDLRLHQEALLLALKDDAGTPAVSVYGYAVGGAVLAELLLEGRIRLIDRRLGAPLVEPTATATSGLGDPVLDAALRRVRQARRRASTTTWLERFSGRDQLRDTARTLVHRGTLRVVEQRVLLLFNRTVYPELDPAPERQLRERLRAAIFDHGPVDERTATLAGIAHHTGLLAPIFGRKALKPRAKRIKALIEGNSAAEATRAAIQAVQAAVIAAATAAAT